MKVLAIIMLVLGILDFSFAADKPSIALSLAADGVIYDGTPKEFDISVFMAKLNKEIMSKFGDKDYLITNENLKYKLSIEIDSVAHKFRPFTFGPKYYIRYKYFLADSSNKKISRESIEASDKDLPDLVVEIAEKILVKTLTAIDPSFVPR